MDESQKCPATIEAACETHVYANLDGTITIRQFDPTALDEEDRGVSIIAFHPKHANAVIAAIRQSVKELRDAG